MAVIPPNVFTIAVTGHGQSAAILADVPDRLSEALQRNDRRSPAESAEGPDAIRGVGCPRPNRAASGRGWFDPQDISPAAVFLASDAGPWSPAPIMKLQAATVRKTCNSARAMRPAYSAAARSDAVPGS